jgi:hypothetical protein
MPALAEDPAQEAAAKPDGTIKTELLHLKYFSGGSMMPLIRTYLSRVGNVMPGPNDKILVIQDHAENITRVRQAVAEVDVKPADLLFTVQLILGSEEQEKGAEPAAQRPHHQELEACSIRITPPRYVGHEGPRSEEL